MEITKEMIEKELGCEINKFKLEPLYENGECADNPNNEIQSRWMLNSFATFIRLNGEGPWFPNGFRRGINGFTAEMCEVATSQEIWDELSKYNYEE